MATNTTVLIVVAGLAVLALVGMIVGVTYKTRTPRRHSTDVTIGDEADKGALSHRRRLAAAIEINTIRAHGRGLNRMSVATKRPPPAIH